MTFEMRRARREAAENKERDNIKDPLTKETMDIRADEQSLSTAFQDPDGLFLRYMGAKDAVAAAAIADTYAKKERWSDTQHDHLLKSLHEFNVRRAELDRVSKVLTPEYIGTIAESHKKIDFILKSQGAERTSQILLKQFTSMAFDNNADFSKIVESIINVRDLHASDVVRGANFKYIDRLKKVGIQGDAVDTVFAKTLDMKGDAISLSEMENASKEARKNMGILMKVADIIGHNAISQKRGRELTEAIVQQRQLLEQSDLYINTIGDALYGSLSDAQHIEMQRVLVEGGEMRKVPETNVNTLKDYAKMREEFTEDASDKRLEDRIYKKMKKLRLADPAELPRAEKESLVAESVAQEVALQKKYSGSGFMNILLSILFKGRSSLEESMRKKLRLV